MTAAEIEDLVNGLLYEAQVVEPADFRGSRELLTDLSDEQFLLAVRWVSGERLVTEDRRMMLDVSAVRARQGKPVEEVDWDAVEQIEDEEEAKAIDLGDVTVGFD